MLFRGQGIVYLDILSIDGILDERGTFSYTYKSVGLVLIGVGAGRSTS